MELTPRQKMLASQVRTMFDPMAFTEVGTAHTLSDKMALVFDGVANGIHPSEMAKHFSQAMHCYVRLMNDTHKTALEDILGGKQKVALVLNHDNAENIVHRILERVAETHGGVIPGKEFGNINVDDILAEEMNEMN